MNKTEAEKEFQDFKQSGHLDNEMLLTSVEFMFFNNNIHTGIIYSYLFFISNRGHLASKKEINVFLPDNYSSGYEVKLGLLILAEICLLIIIVL